MTYPSDLTDAQWALLEPVFKRRASAAASMPMAANRVGAMLYIAHTGSVALSPGVVRAMDSGLVAVPPGGRVAARGRRL